MNTPIDSSNQNQSLMGIFRTNTSTYIMYYHPKDLGNQLSQSRQLPKHIDHNDTSHLRRQKPTLSAP